MPHLIILIRIAFSFLWFSCGAAAFAFVICSVALQTFHCVFGGGDCINAMKCYCCLGKCQSERDILSVAVELTSEVLHPEACHQHMSLMFKTGRFYFIFRNGCHGLPEG